LRKASSLAAKAKNHPKAVGGKADSLTPEPDTANKLEYELVTEQLAAIKRLPATKLAVVLHLYYPDMWDEVFNDEFKLLKDQDFDLFINMPNPDPLITAHIKKNYPSAYIFSLPNRGRDVLPFIIVAKSLEKLGYQYVLKLHSKKSPERIDGEEWLTDMLNKLLPKNKALLSRIIDMLNKPNTAIVGPGGHYISLPVGTVSQSVNQKHVHDLVGKVFAEEKAAQIDETWHDYGFFEGTMFWLRLHAIKPILQVNLSYDAFEPEAGQTDGTLSHALERLFCLCPEINGKLIYEVTSDSVNKIDYKTDNVPEWSELYKGVRRKVTH
jgi:lipopolysaccharide biosynthesis protein